MLCSEPMQRIPQRGAAEGRPPLWWRPKAATFVLALNKAHVLALNTAHVLRSTRQMSWLSARHMSCVSTLRYAQCSQPAQRRPQRGAAEGCPPLWRRPKAASFVLAVNTGHVLVLRRKTCALMRAKTSALLRRKTCAVLRARTCAVSRANGTFLSPL